MSFRGDVGMSTSGLTCDDYGSTGVMYSTGGGAVSTAPPPLQSPRWRQMETQRQLMNQAQRMSDGKQATKGRSMVDEFKGYIHEYKDWIFTIAIIAVVDHFFLDGALKEKLAAALGKKLDGANDAKA